MIHRLRYMQPTASFRSEWQYHNIMYALGGVIIERVSGMPWDAVRPDAHLRSARHERESSRSSR